MYSERPSTRIDGVVLWASVVTGTPTRILPDGCMDIILLGDTAVVAGVDTTARFSDVASGIRCVGARFAPGLLPVAIGVPAAELADRVVRLDDIGVRPLTGRSVRTLADCVFGAKDPCDRLDAELASRICRKQDPLVGRAAALLTAGMPVADVAADIGYSPRHLQRRSAEWFGYGPKHLAGVCRLQRALAYGRSGMTGAEVSAAAGYADHAHLLRDARRLGGASFAELVRSEETSSAQAGSAA